MTSTAGKPLLELSFGDLLQASEDIKRIEQFNEQFRITCAAGYLVKALDRWLRVNWHRIKVKSHHLYFLYPEFTDLFLDAEIVERIYVEQLMDESYLSSNGFVIRQVLAKTISDTFTYDLSNYDVRVERLTRNKWKPAPAGNEDKEIIYRLFISYNKRI